MAGRLQTYSDPLQHALIAATVLAPLGLGCVTTAVSAALAIDVDHAVAARSVRVRHTTALALRPRSHSLVTAAGAAALIGARRGPLHGWAAFAGLASHFLHDAGDNGAPTPMFWPFAPARQLGRRWQLVGTAALALGSLAIRRATAAGSSSHDCGRDGGAAARPRTA
jgi:LexA-binding, inner membrane-associated putative hydrolase